MAEHDVGVEKESDPTESASSTSRGAASGERSSSFGARLWWLLPIAMVVEFYAYGHDGRLEICVGKHGETDFELVGQERTDDNRWKFPRCEARDNLGLRDREDELVPEARALACRGATIFRNRGEAKECIAGEKDWEHRVERSFVPPWDPAYYRHLFWFFK